MPIIEIILGTVFAGLALIILMVSVLSYRRHPGAKLALVSASFMLYAVLAVLVLLSSLFSWSGTQMGPELLLLNIGVVLLLYLSLVKG